MELEQINEVLAVEQIVKEDNGMATIKIARDQFNNAIGATCAYPCLEMGKDINGMNVRIFNFNGVQLESFYSADRSLGTQFVLPLATAKALLKEVPTYTPAYNTSFLLTPVKKQARITIRPTFVKK